VWRLEGPQGQEQVRTNGNVRSNSGEFVREALLAGLGLGLRSTWDIGPEIKSGALTAALPQYRGSSNVAIYAVYPCREFMPVKVNVFIEFLAELYGPEPYWDKGLDLAKLTPKRASPKVAAGGSSKRSRAVASAR
jgi:DNA-binding transcriptional LysR family regulator